MRINLYLYAIVYYTDKLKSFFALLLLTLFAFRPIYHIVYITYFEFNIDAIIEKYCVNKDNRALQCNGKCHLLKTLTLDTAQKNTKESAILSIVEAFFPTYYQKFNYILKLPHLAKSQKTCWNLQNHLASVYLQVPYPPPKV